MNTGYSYMPPMQVKDSGKMRTFCLPHKYFDKLILDKNIYFNTVNRIKSNPVTLLIIIWVIFSFCMAIINTIFVRTFTYDDISNYYKFNNLIKENGVLKTLFDLSQNSDLLKTKEFRTYGLSKVFHCLIHIITGGTPKVYEFLITFIHMLSAVLLYKILSKLNFNVYTVLFTCIIYAVSPFAHMQTFHYFSYLFLPTYILFFYILHELDYLQGCVLGNLPECKNASHAVSLSLIFLIVFTGEYTLSMLGFTIFIEIMVAFRHKCKPLLKKYAFHLIFYLSLFTGYKFVWSYRALQLNGDLIGRFNAKTPDISRIPAYIENFYHTLKYFLFLDNDWKLRISTIYKLNIPLASIILSLFAMLIFSSYKIVSSNFEKRKKVNGIIMLIIFGIIASSMGVYILTEIIYQTGYRSCYANTIFLFGMIGVCLLIGNYLPKKIGVLVFSCILCVCISFETLWCAYLRPHIYATDVEIMGEIDQAISDGVKDVVIFFDSDTQYTTPLLNSEHLEPLSTFSDGWTIEHFLRRRFDNCVLAPKFAEITENGNGTILISDKSLRIYPFTDTEFIANKDSTLFITGYRDESDLRIIKRIYSTSFDEFVAEGGLVCYEDTLLKDALILVDAGAESPYKGFAIDTEFDSGALFNNIRYGYKGPGSMISVYGDGSLFSNRFSSDFSYKFENIPKDAGELDLIVVIHDIWKSGSGKRVFDVIVTTDSGSSVIKDVDPYIPFPMYAQKLMIYNPFMLNIALPETTSVTVTFKAREDMLKDGANSLPFVNVVGLTKREK